ncbi:hypothetical protein [Rhizobium leguminosarum]|uniref:hypothetical protein n=1 Tax=Rhizobium leguminosarum TaxID=384 RepID=UPI00140F9DB9|nr:hypothetical protein [Rhizobium leguminosarum]QIO64721.1 hypothetical protein HA462_06545 [Rhizobium leguminosarum bv. trifolii]
MAKILLGYAYTTSTDKDGMALQKPESFKIDQNLPILLDHPDMRDAPRENKGVILSAAYDALGCKVAVLVFDDELAMATKGLSIAAPRKAYLTKQIGMTPIELSLCKDFDPENNDCRIIACRDATPEEITFAKMGDSIRMLAALAEIGEQIKEVLAR